MSPSLRIRSALGVLSAFAVAPATSGAEPAPPSAGQRVNFVACPLVRDTYIPAWLAEHEGELYYLGPQGDLGTDFYPPQLGHKALIEGVVAHGRRESGGIVLSPVKVSVLPELDPSCNTILPAAGYPDPPHHRTPGPSNSEEREERRAAPSSPPGPPFAVKEFDVVFAFDVADHLYLRDTRAVSQAAAYARAADASRVDVIGYRSGALLSNGERLTEREDIASHRAAMVAGMLAHAGVPQDRLTVRSHDAVAEADGVDDYELRRARIVVRP